MFVLATLGPTLTRVWQDVGTPERWLHAVGDGNDLFNLFDTSGMSHIATDAIGPTYREGLVLSAEVGDNGGTIQVALVDPSNASNFTSAKWQNLITLSSFAVTPSLVLASGSGAEYTGIADHWHVYLNGYHYIGFSLTLTVGTGPTATTDSYGAGLAKFKYSELDGKFHLVADWPIVVYTPMDSSSTYWQSNGLPVVATNDLHIIAYTREGQTLVAVNIHKLPTTPSGTDEGTLVVLIDGDSQASGGTVELTPDAWGLSDDSGAHNSGASAALHPYYNWTFTMAMGFEILAPSSMSPTDASIVRRIRLDPDWALLDLEEYWYSEFLHNYAMPMQARISSEYSVLVYRDISLRAGTSFSDYADIVLELRDSSDNVLYTETLSTNGNRPHVATVDDYVIVTWDEADNSAPPTTFQVVMLVYTLTGLT